jgi:hypothetical protein
LAIRKFKVPVQNNKTSALIFNSVHNNYIIHVLYWLKNELSESVIESLTCLNKQILMKIAIFVFSFYFILEYNIK